jgi:hypothetical protein
LLDKINSSQAETDYLLNCYSDEDEEQYTSRIAKERKEATIDIKPAAKINYQDLSVCSCSEDEENEFTSSL